jgi:hypothetical protein
MASSSPDVKALFNNSPSYIYHLDEGRESLESQHSYLPPTDYWNPQPPITGRHGRFLSMSHADESLPPAGLAAYQGLKEDDNRASDPLLESRLLSAKPRSLTNRAQSLDLTYSLGRITEGASRYPPPPPDSPTNSIGERSSSPASASAPSFPSVYNPSGASRRPIGGHRTSRTLDDDSAAAEVSRVMSNLGL